MMKRLFAFVIILCLSSVFIFPITSAVFGKECGCIAECFCGVDCCCPPEAGCGCYDECTCAEVSCQVCEAIIENKTSEQQIRTVASPFNTDINLPSLINNFEKNIFGGIDTANIVETHVKMNN